MLKLQDAIAAAVVRELQLTVTSEYMKSRATSKNAEAYDLYLRGRHSVDSFERKGLTRGLFYFSRHSIAIPHSLMRRPCWLVPIWPKCMLAIWHRLRAWSRLVARPQPHL